VHAKGAGHPHRRAGPPLDPHKYCKNLGGYHTVEAADAVGEKSCVREIGTGCSAKEANTLVGVETCAGRKPAAAAIVQHGMA
jgi:hypothetical protein